MNDLAPVTIVAPVRDEADRIAEFIAAHRWADAIVVADNGSVDGTAAAAMQAGAKVIDCAGMTIGEARNAGADAAPTDWILALDIDELADRSVADEIHRILIDPGHDAYRLRRRNFVHGREERRGSLARDWVVRLYRRPLRFTGRRVHERLETGALPGTLQTTLSHQPYRDLSHQVAKMDQYARWGAEELHASGHRATLLALAGRPFWRFVKAYLIGGLLFEGRQGLVAAMLGAQTAFLKYAHLLELEREARERLN